jgi:hypothetical protein
MANVNFPKRPPLPRDLDLRPSPDDYRPGATARASAYGREVSDSPPINEVDTPIHHQSAKVGAGANVNLRRLEEQLTREPLDEIATVVRGLTYGEMMEFSEALWKAQPEGSAITQENLSSLLHRWSVIRSAGKAPSVSGK